MATSFEDGMVNREEYARIIESFMREMPGLCMSHNEAALRKRPGLAEELDEYVAQLRDPSHTADTVLATAFGLVDEFVDSAWDEVITESYALYTDLSEGRSRRHSDAEGPSGSG